MTPTEDSPEKPEKPEDSSAAPDGTGADSGDESTLEGAILLDDDLEDEPDDLLDLEMFDDEQRSSDEFSRDFPPDDPEVSSPEPEPQPHTAQMTAPAPEKRSAFPLVLGGVIAGGIGFAAAYGLNLSQSGQSEALASITTNVEGNSADLAALTTRIDEVATSIPAAPDLSGLEGGISALQAEMGVITNDLTDLTANTGAWADGMTANLGTLAEDLGALKERLATLELAAGNADAAQGDAAAEKLAAFQAELEAIVGQAESRIVEAEAEALALRTEAEAAAKAEAEDAERRAAIAAREAALSALKTAVDGGSPFTDQIAELGDVPAELAVHGDTGVPTLVALQQEFAPAARTALSATQTIPENASAGERFTAFLRRQTNARSLAPKAGDDPDAILSRAEAQLSQGDLGGALVEISALPEEARAAMAGWIKDAETRQAALLAVDSLSANLN